MSTQSWSITILKRRLSLFDHLMRLPEKTPTRKALNKFAEPAKKSTGRSSTTWFMNTIKDIRENTNIQLTENLRRNLEILEHMCSDRQT